MAGEPKKRVPKKGESAEGGDSGGAWKFTGRTGPMGSAQHVHKMQEIARIITEDIAVMQQSLKPAVDFLNWDLERARAEQFLAPDKKPLAVLIGDAHHGKALPGMLTRLMVQDQREQGKEVVEVQEDSGKDRKALTRYKHVKSGGLDEALADVKSLGLT